ncbi:hypothetical protein ASD67_02330 [Sphingopyxis sp. Root1497]|uniref:hypothetical protein n=1 Tax=Sphingopyxis sp. Root1497 TaxID=1736474 RepID=UPI0006F38E0C|nr:hypothetical protein [Sphingopyxis sp. Root1497]KQZ65945.1 hypothetical protein ASD67_02330 [Sphingopyxis sp. Root1497]
MATSDPVDPLALLGAIMTLSRDAAAEARAELGNLQAAYLDQGKPVPEALLDLWRCRVVYWEAQIAALAELARGTAHAPAVAAVTAPLLAWLAMVKPDAPPVGGGVAHGRDA